MYRTIYDWAMLAATVLFIVKMSRLLQDYEEADDDR